MLFPEQIVELDGAAEMEIGLFTVNVASFDVTADPQLPVTVHLYLYPE